MHDKLLEEEISVATIAAAPTLNIPNLCKLSFS